MLPLEMLPLGAVSVFPLSWWTTVLLNGSVVLRTDHITTADNDTQQFDPGLTTKFFKDIAANYDAEVKQSADQIFVAEGQAIQIQQQSVASYEEIIDNIENQMSTAKEMPLDEETKWRFSAIEKKKIELSNSLSTFCNFNVKKRKKRFICAGLCIAAGVVGGIGAGAVAATAAPAIGVTVTDHVTMAAMFRKDSFNFHLIFSGLGQKGHDIRRGLLV